jgi:hypothetical protein
MSKECIHFFGPLCTLFQQWCRRDESTLSCVLVPTALALWHEALACSVGKMTVFQSSHSLSCTTCDLYEPSNCEHWQRSSLIIDTKCPATVCKEVKTEARVSLYRRKERQQLYWPQTGNTQCRYVGCSDHIAPSPDSFAYVGNGVVITEHWGPWIQIARFDFSIDNARLIYTKKVYIRKKWTCAVYIRYEKR